MDGKLWVIFISQQLKNKYRIQLRCATTVHLFCVAASLSYS